MLISGFVFWFFGAKAQETDHSKNKHQKEKSVELDEVLIKGEKKAITVKPDRTIFDFESQSHLNSGTVLDGIKKLPGLIVSDIAGMMYQGKMLEVYLDGRPLNISSNELFSFLEGLPANSVEKIEVITQPGAEFPASSGGAIMNIITSKNAKKYFSSTYSTGLEFTNYDNLRNRFNNNLMLSSKNNYFGWQLSIGQNYRENANWSTILNQKDNNEIILSDNFSDKISRMTTAKSALTFDLKKDRLLINYDLYVGNNSTNIDANGLGFVTTDDSKNKTYRQDAVITYQKRFDDPNKKLDLRFNYQINNADFDLNSLTQNRKVLENESMMQFINTKVDYNQDLKILDKGKLSTGAHFQRLVFDTESFGIDNLNYSRNILSGYFELQASLKKFDFILGTRVEDYLIKGIANGTTLNSFDKFRIFPNSTIQYNFSKEIFFNLNYSKKIDLPSASILNPNNTNYQNQNVAFSGNPKLEPTIFNNYGAKLSAFNYAYIGYNYNTARNQIVSQVTEKNNIVTNTSINVLEIQSHSLDFSIPFPYMLITKGLKETVKFNFNPDKIDFLVFNASYKFQQIPNLETKGFWFFYFMSQLVLPKDIKFVTTYNFNTTGGNFNYFIIKESLRKSFDITFSKKFLDDHLTIAVHVDDLFNQNRQVVSPIGTYLLLKNRSDSRRFGINLTYKIPSRNKLAKPTQNLLNKENKEENGTIIN